MRKVSALTSTTSPALTLPPSQLRIAHTSMPPAISDRQMSCSTRAFSRYIQLRRWARASLPISWARRSASRSRAEKALMVQTLDTASTSSPPTRAACAAKRWCLLRPRMPKPVISSATTMTNTTSATAMRQSTVSSTTTAPMKSTIGGTIFHASPP